MISVSLKNTIRIKDFHLFFRLLRVSKAIRLKC